MILSEIKSYLKEKRQASLFELCQYFGSSKDAMRSMLSFLMMKGLVHQAFKNSACGSSCSKCKVETVEIYKWTS